MRRVLIKTRPLFLLSLLTFLWACSGNSPVVETDLVSTEDPGSSEDADSSPDLGPDTSTPPLPLGPTLFLRKLTNYEYENTLRDLLQLPWSPGQNFSDDFSLLGFSNNSSINTVTPDKLFDYLQAAQDIAAHLSIDVEKQTSCLADDKGSRDCMKSFLTRFVSPLYRSPLTKKERIRLMDVFDATRATQSFNAAFEQTMRAVFVAPEFIYRIEQGPKPGGSEDEIAAPYDLASRLSYFLWAGPPDEILREAADSGALTNATDVRFQAERMLESPKTAAMMKHFSLQWLRADLPSSHPAFVQGEVPPSVLEETSRFINHVIFEGQGNLGSLLLSPYSVMNKQVSDYYGGIVLEESALNLNSECSLVALSQGIGQKCTAGGGECPEALICLADQIPTWQPGANSICVMASDCTSSEGCFGDGLSCCSIAIAGEAKDMCMPTQCTEGICAPEGALNGGWAKVEFEDEKRFGLLTQPSVLIAHADLADPFLAPIRRGRFVREQLLCQPVQPPPPGVPVIDPSSSTEQSTQDILNAHTSDPNCAGCHNLMDPIGFVFQEFDASGLLQVLDSNGMPIQTQGEMIGTLDIDGPIDGIEDLANKLASSDQVKDCFIRQWWRFAFGRVESAVNANDLDTLKTLFIEEKGDIKKLLINITQTEAFLRRRKVAP